MGDYCLQPEPINSLEVYFGFSVFAVFFIVLFYCHKRQTGMKIRERQARRPIARMHPNRINVPLKQMSSPESKGSQDEASEYEVTEPDTINQSGVRASFKSSGEVWKKLSAIAYNYVENDYEMSRVYRSREQIERERKIYLDRSTDKAKQTKAEQKDKVSQPTEPSQAKKQGKGLKRAQSKQSMSAFLPRPAKSDTQTAQTSGKVAEKPQNITFPFGSNTTGGGLFNTPQSQPKQQAPKPEQRPVTPSVVDPKTSQILFNNGITGNNRLFPIPESVNDDMNESNKKEQPAPTQNTNSPATIFYNLKISTQISGPEKPAQNKSPLFPPIKPAESIFNSNEPERRTQPAASAPIQPSVPQVATINTSWEYLESIIKAQIKTIISNLSGAKSDPKQIYDFACSYIKSINPNNPDEVATFSFKIWEAIVHKFIKNTNIKDGFEKMPPKEKSKQVEKNSINTYVLLLNIFRVMGYETIWLGVFGRTLKMLDFLYKRKEPIKEWTKLELLEAKYVGLDGDISSKYHSRIDFLTYFLLAMTTFDPIDIFEEVSEKTGENFGFMPDLRKFKHKWSYREFWCVVDCVRKNKTETYFKIPFWNNALTVIYLQMLKNLKQGQMREFTGLSKFIFKEVKELTKRVDGACLEGKTLSDIEEEARDGKYSFDGDEFIGGIKTLGKGIDTREREMRANKWEEFRDKCSIFYYLWRTD